MAIRPIPGDDDDIDLPGPGDGPGPGPGRHNIDKIDHVVVLMLENRSFDHMLGYLQIEKGRRDVDGLKGNERNTWRGKNFPVHRLGAEDLVFEPDPCHSAECTERQLAGNSGGFVASFAEHDEAPQPGKIMGYYGASDVPAFDLLAREYAVCDRWFSSVRGPTWPNRLYALCGESFGRLSNPSRLEMLLGLDHPTFFQYLDQRGVSWKVHAHDISLLRGIRAHRFELKRIAKMDSFYRACRRGELPSYTFIEPNYEDVPDFMPANDDHPPADVRNGQALVAQVYEALRDGGNDLWKKTLFIITYDEHGGFYDHVEPPPVADARPAFRRLGVRLPALVASPWIPKGSVSHEVFDHTSIIKTVLRRFCRDARGRVPRFNPRVDAAADLGSLLSLSQPRTTSASMPRIRARFGRAQAPTELQQDARLLREITLRKLGRVPEGAARGVPQGIDPALLFAWDKTGEQPARDRVPDHFVVRFYRDGHYETFSARPYRDFGGGRIVSTKKTGANAFELVLERNGDGNQTWKAQLRGAGKELVLSRDGFTQTFRRRERPSHDLLEPLSATWHKIGEQPQVPAVPDDFVLVMAQDGSLEALRRRDLERLEHGEIREVGRRGGRPYFKIWSWQRAVEETWDYQVSGRTLTIARDDGFTQTFRR